MTSEELCNKFLRQHTKSILLKSIKEGKYCDVVFKVGGTQNYSKEFKGIKSFFAVQSNKFDEILLNSEEKDGIDISDSIHISDIKPKIFSFIQKLFYGLFDIRINTEIVIYLMEVAKRYNIQYLQDTCSAYIFNINFNVYSASFFNLLLETQTTKMESICIQIIDHLQPISNISEYHQFFNPKNKHRLSKLCSDIVIYLLFYSQKFTNIPQEFKWKICVFWSTHNGFNNDDNGLNDDNDLIQMPSMAAIKKTHTKIYSNYFSDKYEFELEIDNQFDDNNDDNCTNDINDYNKLKLFVKHFIFTEMDWNFFIENVYTMNVLNDNKVIYILCDYIMKHSEFILSCDRKKRKCLRTTKFIKYVKLQQLFVHQLQTTNIVITDDISANNEDINKLIEFIEFNTQSIDDKVKQEDLYNSWDAYFEQNRTKKAPFLYVEESIQKYNQIEKYSKELLESKDIDCPSKAVELLNPKLCESIESKLNSAINCKSLSDVTFRLTIDKSLHYGIRGLFAMHSKVFDAMLFSTGFIESNKQNEVHLNISNKKLFKTIQQILYGLKCGKITRYNVADLYCFFNAYLMIELRTFALKFICSIQIDQYKKATDFLSIIVRLHNYQNDGFWDLFISQIKKENIPWTMNECDMIIRNKDFNKLSNEMIKQFVFKSTLFKCYSSEMFWQIIVKYCDYQKKEKKTNRDPFLINILKQFLNFFDFNQMNYFKITSKEFLILLMNVVSYKKIFQNMQNYSIRLKKIKQIFNDSLFKLLPFDIVDEMIFNFTKYHKISEEVLWTACVKWNNSNKKQNKKQSFLKYFKFHTMSINYFKNKVVPLNVLTEYQIMSVYERFCDYHGLYNTINANNVIKLCFGANRHSLNKLQRNCLKYVATMRINISDNCSQFLIIIKQLYDYGKIKKFISLMSSYMYDNNWSRSECYMIVNNKKYFNKLPSILVQLILFKSNQFKNFSEMDLWGICVNWSCYNMKNINQRNKKLRDFVPYFAFAQMPIWYFRENVEPLNVLTDSETMVINQHFVTHLLNVVEQKNQKIKNQKRIIEDQEETIDQQDTTIRNQNTTISNLNYTVRSKNNTITDLEYQISNLEATIRRLKR